MENSFIDQARRRFIYLIAVVGFVQAILFLTSDVFFSPARFRDFIFNGATALTMVLLFIWTRKAANIGVMARIVTATLLILIFYFIFTVVDPFTAGLTFPMFPLIAFFLGGRKVGMYWLVVYFVGVAAFFSAAYLNLISAQYLFLSGISVQVVNLVLYISTIYFYVDVEDKSKELLTDQSRKQAEINVQLTQEIKARKEVEIKLRQAAESLKRMNDLIVGRELKMTELKKENEELRKK